MKSFLRRLWSSWTHLTRRFGDFQARWILALFYFTVMLPFGLIARVLLDPLNVRRAPIMTAWNARPPGEDDNFAAAQREF